MNSMPTTRADSATEALEMMPSGIYLPPNAVKTSLRIAVDATAHTDQDIPDLVDRFSAVQLRFPFIKPVFLVSALDPAELTRAGYIYETVIPEAAWDKLDAPATYKEYQERRFHEMIVVYQAQKMVTVEPGEDLPRWIYER